MATGLHHAYDTCESDEVLRFRRSQWIHFEKRNYSIRQFGESSYRVPVKILSMIVRSTITADVAASETLLQHVENIHTALSLHDRERRLDLPTDSTRSITEEWHAEAAFAVNETDDPLREAWPFLLIVRTGRIFTSHINTLRVGCISG